MNFYWELITKDDTRYEIPPEAVEVVNRRMSNHDPINLKTATIPFSEIKHFRITSKPHGQPLLEAAAQAFNEPMFNDAGEIFSKWVKKSVPQREYTKHYAAIPAYRNLGSDNNMVVVAFRLPIHQIDLNLVSECADDEINRLT